MKKYKLAGLNSIEDLIKAYPEFALIIMVTNSMMMVCRIEDNEELYVLDCLDTLSSVDIGRIIIPLIRGEEYLDKKKLQALRNILSPDLSGDYTQEEWDSTIKKLMDDEDIDFSFEAPALLSLNRKIVPITLVHSKKRNVLRTFDTSLTIEDIEPIINNYLRVFLHRATRIIKEEDKVVLVSEYVDKGIDLGSLAQEDDDDDF